MAAKEVLPWFPCEPTKLLAALAQMQPSEGYVYCIMLLRIYECGGACPDDIDAIATRARFNRRVTADALNRLFKSSRLIRESDGIHNPKADDVIESAWGLRKKRKESGAKGAVQRWQKGEQKQQKSDGKAIPEPIAKDGYLQEQLQIQEEGKGKTPPDGGLFPADAARSDWPADYRDQFWDRYPKRTEKKAAIAKLEAVRKSGKVEWAKFVGAVDAFAAHVSGTEWRFIKAPLVWLNKGCWEDELKSNGGSDGRYGKGGGAGFGARGDLAGYALDRARLAGEKRR